jgi:DNA-binding NarL/FixJ family response regulator
MTRILIVDSSDIVRIGLKSAIKPLPYVEICGESSDGLDGIRKAAQLQPHIVISDFRLPMANGAMVARRILREHPKQKVLIFASIESRSVIKNLLLAGIRGLVSRNEPLDEVLCAIDALHHGRTYFTSRVQHMILAEFLNPPTELVEPEGKRELTQREQEVAQLLAEGKVTKEIAILLGITFKTAATHRSNVMRKLEVHNLAEMTLKAISNGIIDVPLFTPPLRVIDGGLATAPRENVAKAAA